MKLLIVGLGYAGKRYQRAFRHLAGTLDLPLDIAYVARQQRIGEALPYYPDVPRALAEFHPDVVVVSVNDHAHVGILHNLAGFAGFVLCEKPLATNYLQHSLVLDYAPAPNLLLNATLYHYRPWRAADLLPGDSMSWRNRLRLHFAVLF